jgi:hypothetical protein
VLVVRAATLVLMEAILHFQLFLQQVEVAAVQTVAEVVKQVVQAAVAAITVQAAALEILAVTHHQKVLMVQVLVLLGIAQDLAAVVQVQ